MMTSIRLRLLSFILGVFASCLHGADSPDFVFFETEEPGVKRGIETWGLEVTWPSYDNTVRTLEFMGQNEIDFVRVAFHAAEPLVDGKLPKETIEIMDRMSALADLAGLDKPWSLTPGTEAGVDSSYKNGNEVDPVRWVELMKLSAEHYNHPFFFIEPFNEPDYGWGQGTKENLVDICKLLKTHPNFSEIPLAGASTLSCDKAIAWNYPARDYLDFGTTHSLAGSCSNYIGFYQNMLDKGLICMNPEAHNIVEPMIGAEYGMQVSMWWGVAEWTRSCFVRACQGMRLAYAENRANWTAASVYRNPEGEIKGFVGASERMATTTNYKFVSKDRDVFYDGYGPQREFDVRIPGGTAYWENQPNAERVISIDWGEDIQPPVDGRYVIVNRAAGLVLEVEDQADWDGANIILNARGELQQQLWDVTPLESDHGGDYAYFSILSASSGKAADVYDWNLNAGADVRQWHYYGNPNQVWVLDYVEDGFFRIRSRWSGKYLEIVNGPSIEGMNVQLGELNEHHHQHWRLIPVDAQVEFVSPEPPSGFRCDVYQVSVVLNWDANQESDLAGYNIYRSNDPEGPFELIARNVVETSYTDPTANQPKPYYYKITAVDHSINRSDFSEIIEAIPNGQEAVIASYDLESSGIDDSGNGNHAKLSGDFSFQEGLNGSNAISLDGIDSWIQLPACMLNHPKLTFACSVFWRGGEENQCIFDFGTGTKSNMCLTPNNDVGLMEFSLRNGEDTVTLQAPPLKVEQWTRLELIITESKTSLFVDGQLVDSVQTKLRPLDLNPVLNYLGRGQSLGRPLFNGKIDDIRIYNFSIR